MNKLQENMRRFGTKNLQEQSLMVADKKVYGHKYIKQLAKNGFTTKPGMPDLMSFAIKGDLFISFDGMGNSPEEAMLAATQNRKEFEQREGSRLKYMIPTIKQIGDQFESKEIIKIIIPNDQA